MKAILLDLQQTIVHRMLDIAFGRREASEDEVRGNIRLLGTIARLLGR